MKLFARLLPLAALSLSLPSCQPELTPQPAPAPAAASQADASAAGFPEGFETGTKTAYTTGTVTLGSGPWTLNDALLGNTVADRKTGAQSVRLRNLGSLSVDFNTPTGAATVSVSHAAYGTDGASAWELWKSADGGATYAKVGSTITTSSTALQTATFTLNQSGSLRLQVRKVSGGTNRLNIDNVDVQQYGGTTPPPTTGGRKFLFDASHAETAGNADWVLDVDAGVVPRFPTPAASGITAGTPETYWTAGISAWGVALVKLGHSVEQLPTGTPLTYGNAANPQDLANYSVFVVDEPNTLFTAAEKTAIVRFVQNGGGLFMISDHDISDRNNDGYDSPDIWNDLMSSNGVQADPFGFRIDLNNISETSLNVLAASTNPILNGSQGAVTQLAFHNGASITKTSNSAAQPLIWRSSAAQGLSQIMCASSTFGSGRVVIVGDSSPADDGTGSPGNTVYPGWTEHVSHARLHLNASLWLAKLQ